MRGGALLTAASSDPARLVRRVSEVSGMGIRIT